MAEEDTKKMQGIIDHLLLLARIDVESVDRTPIDIAELVREVDDSYRKLGIRSRLNLHPELKFPIAENSLKIVLDNIWRNALVHAGEGTELTIESRESKESYILAIEDNGPGVADELLKKVDGEFYSTATSFGGTGLGLSIVGSVVAKYGGTLSIDKSGSGFALTIMFSKVNLVWRSGLDFSKFIPFHHHNNPSVR